jgi:multidrug efflux pump subunit AcrB
MKKSFNLTEWALNHKQYVYFFVVLLFTVGIFSYKHLGRLEDPDFTIKQMVISVPWPGATAGEVQEQVTDKIEKKLQDLPGLDYLKSYSMPGQTVIYVNVKDTVPKEQIRSLWLETRNMVNDMKGTLPEGTLEPIFNDRFDEVYGVVYTLTGDDYSYEEKREKAEKIRRMLLDTPSVRKVKLIGVQTEKFYIEIENSKLAQLGIDPNLITQTLQGQNSMTPAGMLETHSDDLYLRVTGMFEDAEDISDTPISAHGKTFRLGDIAKITRGYAEPQDPKMFYNGEPTIGIALAMESGGNILTLGDNLAKTVTQIKKELPAGLTLNQTVNQPKVVDSSINEFVHSLAEAIIIVLIVSFVSLGVHSGIIVALCIPLVIAAVFGFMYLDGISLQNISLGSLIIALGLLVDDAIITIEMISVKLEQGWTRFNATCFAYTSTAYPRLCGALVTCAGFIPIGFSPGSAAEAVGSIFQVITASLMISWIVAGTVTPLLGYQFIKVKPIESKEGEPEKSVYDSKFYNKFKKILILFLTHRKKVLIVTLICFIGSCALLGHVKKEFFGATKRPELIVQLQLQEGASLKNIEEGANQFSQMIKDDKDIDYYTYHVGEGAPRFVLAYEPVFNKTNFSEFVIVAKNQEARDRLDAKIKENAEKNLPGIRVHTKLLSNGPPAEYPVMLRVRGYDVDKVREIAENVQSVMAKNQGISKTALNWDEKSKVIRLSIDQDKARALGITSQAIKGALQTNVSGTSIAEFRENDKTVKMLLRSENLERNDPSNLKNVNIRTANGTYVPLDQIAKINYEAEEGLIYRYDLKPMIIVQGEVKPGVTGNDVTQAVYDELKDVRDHLPFGYSIEFDGSMENSIKASKFLAEPIPAMFIIIMLILMTQLQSIPKMVLTLLTAPLGLIGVSIGLTLTGRPMGFVVQLGILALAGIIMRNSVILIDQIDQLLNAGQTLWDSIINATIMRFRPILLTATAAILAMIPLVSSVMWGAMAVAIAFGLAGATILTLLVLPVMYAAWYKAEPSKEGQQTKASWR